MTENDIAEAKAIRDWKPTPREDLPHVARTIIDLGQEVKNLKALNIALEAALGRLREEIDILQAQIDTPKLSSSDEIGSWDA